MTPSPADARPRVSHCSQDRRGASFLRGGPPYSSHRSSQLEACLVPPLCTSASQRSITLAPWIDGLTMKLRANWGGSKSRQSKAYLKRLGPRHAARLPFSMDVGIPPNLPLGCLLHRSELTSSGTILASPVRQQRAGIDGAADSLWSIGGNGGDHDHGNASPLFGAGQPRRLPPALSVDHRTDRLGR
jgi:hypothetical protein